MYYPRFAIRIRRSGVSDIVLAGPYLAPFELGGQLPGCPYACTDTMALILARFASERCGVAHKLAPSDPSNFEELGSIELAMA